ncbi:MAG TPA: lipocalin-like domain-containing protein [Candidatus Limnocylindria bacterium]|nr:lipocalin-like domain-containing protein [Candidatus Limnocylindria bacterium]
MLRAAVAATAIAAVGACANPAPQALPQSTGPPVPVPAESAAVSLPADMYLHPGAPTEWWWNIGTLRAGERVFGFEINAAGFPMSGWAFTQIMLTDVQNEKHYQSTTVYLPPKAWDPQRWAESDPTKNWFARLGDPASELGGIAVTDPGSGYTTAPTVTISGGGGTGAAAIATLDPEGGVDLILLTDPGTGYTSTPEIAISGDGTGAQAVAHPTYVSMSAPGADPTKDLRIEALMADETTLTPVKFDLTETQHGPPFIVWGTGVNSTDHSLDLQHKNYYFSLTRLETTGTITLDGEEIPVTGVTWMDHEYGAFGSSANPVKWNLTDQQLSNGWSLSNYFLSKAGEDPPAGVAVPSYSTLQSPDGQMYYVASTMTPLDPQWTSPVTGETYYTRIRVEIPLFDADFTVTAWVPGQEFPTQGAPVYEGIGWVEGVFQGEPVTGDAWIEQAH